MIFFLQDIIDYICTILILLDIVTIVNFIGLSQSQTFKIDSKKFLEFIFLILFTLWVVYSLSSK